MLDPLEFDELTALRFIAYLSLNNLSLASIRVYLSGVRAWLVAAGIPHRDIYTTRLKWALKSVERASPGPVRASPVSYQMLYHLQRLLPYDYDNLMIFSAMLLAYFGCLRASEYCFSLGASRPLVASAVTFHQSAEPFMVIRVPSSKTSIAGCSGTEVCAYCSLSLYLRAIILIP